MEPGLYHHDNNANRQHKNGILNKRPFDNFQQEIHEREQMVPGRSVKRPKFDLV